MTLADLKILLHIPADDTSQDAFLTKMLSIGIKWLKRVCRNEFIEDGVTVIPEELQPIVAAYIEGETAENVVVSESVGGMSQTFAVKERDLIKKISELGYRRIKFTPHNRRR